MSVRFAGRVIIITGAATGIGRATALQFAQEGASLVLTTSRNRSALDRTVAEAIALGAECIGLVADAGSAADSRRVIEAAVNEFGRLDVLVVNAAYQHKHQPVDVLAESEWDRTIETTLKGLYLAARDAIPVMTAQGGGAIIAVSSVNSNTHVPGLSAYSAAKGGVDALVRQLAVEHGPRGIRVNAVNPGLIVVETVRSWLDANPEEALAARESHPLNRAGEPEEVARAIAFLASDDASFVTGVTLPVDGGLAVQAASAVIRPGLRRGWRSGSVRFEPEAEEDDA